ncbi:MAG: ABC transporter permease [bacterium]|nr:ABC transporter permease [bacterium]
MNNIVIIFKKEFNSYFNSHIAYIFITVFLILSGWLFLRGFFLINQATMRGYFDILPWLFLFFVPAITMRLWSEEKKLGTLEILYTLPLKNHEIVLGKFLASFLFLILNVSLTFTIPLMISMIGNPDHGPIVGSYIGAFLMGGAYLAIGLFASSLTENQIVAFIIGVVISFILLIIGENFILLVAPDILVPVLRYLGLGVHFDSIGRGVIDTRDLIYYLSIIVVFLYFNIQFLESKKWR